MAFHVKASVDVKPLVALLDQLGKTVRNKVLRKAVGAATKVVLKVAKNLAPRETGMLRKALGRKVKVYRSTGTVVGIVGPRTKIVGPVTRKRGKWLPTTAKAWPVKYAHLVELGVKPHGQRRGQHPGHAAKPFLGPAVRSMQATVKSVMVDAITQGLAQAASGKGAA